jgi:hypothetical protein
MLVFSEQTSRAVLIIFLTLLESKHVEKYKRFRDIESLEGTGGSDSPGGSRGLGISGDISRHIR